MAQIRLKNVQNKTCFLEYITLDLHIRYYKILYNLTKRKNMKLPFKIMLSDPKSKHTIEKVQNPYSGESCELPRYAVAVYDVIKGAELLDDHKTMRKGLDWFQKNFTNQYYVLLD